MNRYGLTIVMVIVLAGSVFAGDKAAGSSADSTGRIISTNPERTRDAISYYKKLTEGLSAFRQANYNYVKTLTKVRKARSVEKTRQELLKVIETIKVKVRSGTPFEGDDELRSELTRYLSMLFVVLKEDFDKILDMEDIEAQTEDEDEAHQMALDMAMEKLHECYSIMSDAEDAFFSKYEINVNRTKDEITIKIERANSAIDYYNRIYRIFYRVNKQDAHARNAVAAKDVSGLEQHTATLKSYVEENTAALKECPPFEGDAGLLNVASEALAFYGKEAAVTYPANVDFYMQTDNFEKTMKRFNAIRESDRKQQDVDEYNKAVAVFNKSVKNINKINNESFKKQKLYVDKWNKQLDAFFKKHS